MRKVKVSVRTLATLLLVLTNGVMFSLQLDDDARQSVRRRVSVALPDGGCKLTKAVPASKEVDPSFVASYPGSGSSMVRVLIPALTGLKMTVPRKVLNGNLDAVALKTHYPQIKYMPKWAERIKRVVILMRNPMQAIPSLCNYEYERDNDFPTHSVKAPTGDWIKWRDSFFIVELGRWVDLIEHWLESERIEDRFILAYEDITNDATGPATAVKLGEFFDRSPGVKSLNAEAVPCVWTKVVHGVEPIKLLHGGRTKRIGSKKDREYTVEQLEAMKKALTDLSSKYADNKDLARVLNRYINDVSKNLQEVIKQNELDVQ